MAPPRRGRSRERSSQPGDAERAVGMDLRGVAPEILREMLLADEKPCLRQARAWRRRRARRRLRSFAPSGPAAPAGKVEAIEAGRATSDAAKRRWSAPLRCCGAQDHHRHALAAREIVGEIAKAKGIDRAPGARARANPGPSPISSRKAPSNWTMWFSVPRRERRLRAADLKAEYGDSAAPARRESLAAMVEMVDGAGHVTWRSPCPARSAPRSTIRRGTVVAFQRLNVAVPACAK